MAEVTPSNPLGAGRPKADLDEALRKMKPFLELGYSFYKACTFALLPHSTYLPYYNNDDNFRYEVELLRATPNIQARKNIIGAIKEGKTGISLEWLDRVEKDDFSKRLEMTGKDGEPVAGLNDSKVLATLLQSYELVSKKLKPSEDLSKGVGSAG